MCAAMDTLDPRRRRPPAVIAGNEAAGPGTESTYETVLGQDQQGQDNLEGQQGLADVTSVAARTGPISSSSTYTMELGLMVYPFHSTMVQEEVQETLQGRQRLTRTAGR